MKSSILGLGLLTIAGCTSAPRAEAIVLTAPAPLEASAAPSESTDAVTPELPPGRAGWFELGGEMVLGATMLPDGNCQAIVGERAWTVTPRQSGNCDGDVTATVDLPGRASAMVVLGSRVAYLIGSDVWIAASWTQEPVKLEGPFKEAERLVATGGVLLVVGTGGQLHRLVEDRWESVKLDGSKVRSIEGSSDGQTYAVTAKNGLFGSIDEGKTWKRIAHEWRELTNVLLLEKERGTAEFFVGGMLRAGGYGSGTLNPASTRSFREAHIRPALPEGVTDRNGVPLAKVRAMSDGLLGGRKECMNPTIASDSLGVVVCNEETSSSLMMTDDGGITVREVHREARRRHLTSLEISNDEILQLIDCARDRAADCREEQAVVLVRVAGDTWSRHALPVRASDRLSLTMTDRTGRGGFWLFGTSEEDSKREPVAYHTDGKRAQRYVLALRLPNRDSSEARVLSANIMKDGKVSLLAILSDSQKVAPALAVFTLSQDGNITRSRQTEAPEFFRRLPSGSRDELVLLWSVQGNQLHLSTAAGAFKTYAPAALQGGFDEETVRCGSAGCDFRRLRSGAYLAWRWGSGPLEDTLTGPLSQRAN